MRYGFQIILNEVLLMTPTEYEERLLEIIPPRWRKGLLSAHTTNRDDLFEVTDGSIVIRAVR